MLITNKNDKGNLAKYLVFTFSLLIIIGGVLNTLSNKTYLNDSWTIGEWLINYEGGFVRRGLLGEALYLFSIATKISPIFIIWLIFIKKNILYNKALLLI